MQSRTPHRTVIRAATVAVVAGLIATAGISSAAADQPSDPSWQDVHAAARSAAAARAEIARINSRLGMLQAAADKAGRAAQRADEQYLKAEATAAAAAVRQRQAETDAAAAAVVAKASRNRAGALSAYLARTGSTDQSTSSLLLGGGGVSRTLYRLSRMSQLSVESVRASRKADRDSDTAARLRAVATDAARSLKATSDEAHTSYVAAKKRSDAAARVVRWQLSRQSVLAAQLAALGGTGTDATHTGGGAAHAGGASTGIGAASTVALPVNASKAARVVAFARAQIGEPYVFGAAGPSSWDCSGLTLGAYASVGVSIGIHSATAQYNVAQSEGKLVPYSAAQPGDLVFYTDGGGDMYHIAIYSGAGNMIEAPYEGKDVREVPVRSYQLLGSVARFSS